MVGEGKEDSYAGKLYDGGICFPIVLWSLAKALSNKSCLFLAAYDGPIRVVFIIESPVNANSFAAMGECRALESFPGFQAVIFPLHSGQPHRIVRSVNGFVIGVRRLIKIPGTIP
jgi:hypothetical protein